MRSHVQVAIGDRAANAGRPFDTLADDTRGFSAGDR
jgi:hypothetical protein